MNEPDGVLAQGRLPVGVDATVRDAQSLSAEEFDEVLQLLLAGFEGEWPALDLPVSAAEHLHWKLEGGFADQPSYLPMGHIDGRLVRVSSTVTELVLVDGAERPYYLGGDSVTHPDHMGTGIYNEMRDFEIDNTWVWADGVFTITRNPILVERARRRGGGMPRTAEPRVLVRIFRPGTLAGTRASSSSSIPNVVLRAGFALHHLAGSLLAMLKRNPSGDWDIVKVERFDEGFDDLFAEAAKPFRFIKIRSSKYLAWRYLDRRGGEFETYAAAKDGTVLGYIALKVQSGRGYVLDLLARPGREDVAWSLLQRAAQRFREAKVIAAECWIPPRHPHRGLLRRNGYFDTRRPSGTTVSTFPARAHDLDFFAEKNPKVHLMLGDIDNV